MGSLSTENFHLLLICFPQKRAPCPRYVLSLFTISNAQHFPARIRAAHLASNFISLSLLEQPGLCSALPAPSGVHGNNSPGRSDADHSHGVLQPGVCLPFLLSNTSWALGPRPTTSTQSLLQPATLRPQRGGKSRPFPVSPLRLCQHVT